MQKRMSRGRTWFVVCLALAPLGACGGASRAPTYQDSPSDPLSAHRVGAPSASASSDAGSTQACNTLAARSTPAPAETDEAAFPNFEGGTIAKGTYVVTRVAYHTGSGASPAGPMYPGLDETILIDATTVQAVNMDGAVAGRWSATWSVTGTTLRWSRTCPDHESVEFGFTATPTSLTLGLRMDGSDIVVSYTKVD